MGKHFDTLVEITKKWIIEGKNSAHIKDYKSYLEGLINNCALFELAIDPKEILHVSEKDKDEFVRYMYDYFEMSKKYGEFILSPFPLTAIEDDISVVIMEKLGGNRFMTTICNMGLERGFEELGSISSLVTGSVELNPNGKIMEIKSNSEFYATFNEKGDCYFNSPMIRNHSMYDLANAANAYVEELVYLMDPENFIIEKESNQSKGMRERKEKSSGKRKKLDKTIMRPHYICLSEEDLRDFVKNESKEPMPAHTVRGHMRRLISEKFVKMKGQSIYIKQYFTGQGKIMARGGWNYQVYVKEAPNKIVPYLQTTN
jgi:hypothetical protein